MKRYLTKFIAEDLQKKMVFVGGPRQVGKTTLSLNLSKQYIKNFEYFNWDIDEDRRAIIQKKWASQSELIIFDELHKYPRWKQWIKGVYDAKPKNQQYLVTGSARLDVYRRGGDSLMGRYHHWRLHPLSLDELPFNMNPQEAYERLLTFGGFPEPFLLADEREARRWRKERFDRIIKEDVRDLENIQNLQLLTLFTEALRHRVGSLIVLNNLAEDLDISPKTAKRWLELIKRMYIAFTVYPLTHNVPRSIKKPPKVYFYDNADILDGHAERLENLVATTLLKRAHFIEDYYGHTCHLHYIRDKDHREIDFALVKDGKLALLVEVKKTDTDISQSLQYYTKKLKPKQSVQIVGNLKRSFDKNGILVINPIDYFSKNIPWEV